jgi:ANTAR domain
MSRADLWEASADERERLADEREQLADEREALADERERLADRHDRELDRRDADGHTGAFDAAAEVAATQAALRRAEAGMQRAEAQLLRARQAATRAAARAARRTAADARIATAEQTRDTVDRDELAWLADRRSFVAAEREEFANERDRLADDRDGIAGLRERMADEREYELLDRERDLDDLRRTGHSLGEGALRRVIAEDLAPYAQLRARGGHQRESAATSRRAAVADRARAADSWGPQAYGPMLVASFAQLAQQLFGADDLADVLPPILKHTVDVVTGCDWASITLWRHERVVYTVASHTVAAELDDLQFGTGLGPSPEALHRKHPIYVARLADSPQWPVLAATATQIGVASALCHGLFVHYPARWSAMGTLSLYSATPDAFGDEDQEFAIILAVYVAVAAAMAQGRDEVERREAALHRALNSRDVIGQAKGILMERQRLSAGAAFDLLRRASQRLHRKLTEVAQHLAETGELPT